MNIEVKKLTMDLLSDWLYFFDQIGFSDNEHWSGCYCMCNHLDEEYKKQYNWNIEIEKGTNSVNREKAIKLIKDNRMHGYLAYNNHDVVGWCNANDKNIYKPLFGELPWMEDTEKNEKIKAIMCFCIDPQLRNKGIASLLLQKVCLDAAVDGYKYIEAYPFVKNEENNYQGPLSMYIKNGFTEYGKIEPIIIVRKYL